MDATFRQRLTYFDYLRTPGDGELRLIRYAIVFWKFAMGALLLAEIVLFAVLLRGCVG